MSEETKYHVGEIFWDAKGICNHSNPTTLLLTSRDYDKRIGDWFWSGIPFYGDKPPWMGAAVKDYYLEQDLDKLLLIGTFDPHHA